MHPISSVTGAKSTAAALADDLFGRLSGICSRATAGLRRGFPSRRHCVILVLEDGSK